MQFHSMVLCRVKHWRNDADSSSAYCAYRSDNCILPITSSILFINSSDWFCGEEPKKIEINIDELDAHLANTGVAELQFLGAGEMRDFQVGGCC